MLKFLNNGVEDQGDQTQHHESGDQIVQLEDLAGIDDQIPETFSGSEKFSDDHTDQAETDIDFENADHGRQAGREDHIAQSFSFTTSKSMDELDLSLSVPKCSIHADNAAKDGHGHACNDNSAGTAS